jgi:predicted RNase H-like HicB family nuclease
MSLRLQLEYWQDGDWLVGRLAGVPGVFSQGATLAELEENILDAYQTMLAEQPPFEPAATINVKELEVFV